MFTRIVYVVCVRMYVMYVHKDMCMEIACFITVVHFNAKGACCAENEGVPSLYGCTCHIWVYHPYTGVSFLHNR